MSNLDPDRPVPTLALVSGATGALGSAVCRRLLRAGWFVEMLGRDPARLAQARQAIANDAQVAERLGTCVADINDEHSTQEAVRTVAARHPGLNLLVHAAGDGPMAPLLETTEALWQRTLQGKLMGAVRLARAAAACMQGGAGGHIIIVNGTFSKEPHPLFPINSAVNCALAGFAKAISHDLGPRGIRVNVVNPGITSSLLWDETARALAVCSGMDVSELNAQLLARNPLGRFATPDDVAEAVHWLSRPESAYLNGATLDVDGGNSSAL
ncbi:MAG TPA: SDR family oxidoreductase [Burkholderiaceae bacterium]|nr:SDR family oxidoreductase [Burkholderiaceae bacterium]